jgi:hypothetical protein
VRFDPKRRAVVGATLAGRTSALTSRRPSVTIASSADVQQGEPRGDGANNRNGLRDERLWVVDQLLADFCPVPLEFAAPGG